MHIVIVGGGRVGKELAANLHQKQHSVVVVEKDPERAKDLEKNLDILIINEDGANMATLEKARIRSADIFIAVTQIDELNLMACMMADRAKVPTTIARVRNPESHSNIADTGFSKEEVGVDYIINPERAVALEISKMIHYPDALEIEYFAKGKVMMVSTTVSEKAEITAYNLQEMPLPKGCIIVGIKRVDGRFIVPSGKDTVKAGDTVYLIGNVKVMRKASWLLHHEETKVRKVVILGGGTIGYTLASILENNSGQNFQIKLIEKDEKRCGELKRSLAKTAVLQGDSSELSYFNREEIAEADVLVTATEDDRTNIIAAVMGKNLGTRIIISEVANNAYSYVYETAGIEKHVNPYLITAYQILRFTRKGDVISLSHLKEEFAEVMELVIPESCRVAGKNVAEARFPKGMLIGTIVRDDDVIVPHGDTILKPGDDLIIFTLTNISHKLDAFFCKA